MLAANDMVIDPLSQIFQTIDNNILTETFRLLSHNSKTHTDRPPAYILKSRNVA